MLQELSTTSTLALFQTTKEQRNSFVNDVISTVIEGRANPIEVRLQIAAMMEICCNILASEEFKAAQFDEAQKHGKRFTFQSAEFMEKEAGVKYDFSKSNDPIYHELKLDAEKATNDLKEREKFLKTVPAKGQDIIHEGELITIFPPSKSSTTILQVTLK